MRKVLTLALAAIAAVSLVPMASAAGGKQSVSGAVPLPAPYTDDSGCYAGLHRRFAIVTQEAVGQSPIGYSFNVDKKTVKKPFNLKVTGGVGVDLDIYFYTEFGTAEDLANDPVNAGAPTAISFNTRKEGGEAGKVPAGSTRAIVCMMPGGAGATFDYQAGKGVKK